MNAAAAESGSGTSPTRALNSKRIVCASDALRTTSSIGPPDLTYCAYSASPSTTEMAASTAVAATEPKIHHNDGARWIASRYPMAAAVLAASSMKVASAACSDTVMVYASKPISHRSGAVGSSASSKSAIAPPAVPTTGKPRQSAWGSSGGGSGRYSGPDGTGTMRRRRLGSATLSASDAATEMTPW